MVYEHETVLLTETVDALEVNPNGIYIDCTLGGAGHASLLLSQLTNRGHLYVFDQDINAIDNAKNVLSDSIKEKKVTFIHQNFRKTAQEMEERGVHYVDGIYFDLGVSSPQLDTAERGFSYHKDATLDMRMNPSQNLSAYEVVNQWEYSELVKIIFRYGEEKFAKRIARAIEREREQKPIETTLELSDIIKEAIPAATRRTGGHPAKRTFQAIRIAVNDELGALSEALEQSLQLLKVEGRLAVISFHSLEDRLVKQLFKEKSTPPETPPNMPIIPEEFQPEFKIVNRKPIVADEEEINTNNRARSAKLRIIERIRIVE